MRLHVMNSSFVQTIFFLSLSAMKIRMFYQNRELKKTNDFIFISANFSRSLNYTLMLSEWLATCYFLGGVSISFLLVVLSVIPMKQRDDLHTVKIMNMNQNCDRLTDRPTDQPNTHSTKNKIVYSFVTNAAN